MSPVYRSIACVHCGAGSAWVIPLTLNGASVLCPLCVRCFESSSYAHLRAPKPRASLALTAVVFAAMFVPLMLATVGWLHERAAHMRVSGVIVGPSVIARAARAQQQYPVARPVPASLPSDTMLPPRATMEHDDLRVVPQRIFAGSASEALREAFRLRSAGVPIAISQRTVAPFDASPQRDRGRFRMRLARSGGRDAGVVIVRADNHLAMMGLMDGDVVTSVNGRSALSDGSHYHYEDRLMTAYEVLRQGERMLIAVTHRALPTPQPMASARPRREWSVSMDRSPRSPSLPANVAVNLPARRASY